MNILIGFIIFFCGFVFGASRERQLSAKDWIKSKQDLEDIKQIYLNKIQNLK